MKRFATAVVFGALLSTGITPFVHATSADKQAGAAGDTSPVVLRYGDVVMTENEMIQKMGAALNQPLQQVQQYKQSWLERRVRKMVFEKAAAEAKMPVKEWTKKEIAKRTTPPTEQEINEIFTSNPQLDKNKPETRKEVTDYLLTNKQRAIEQTIQVELARKYNVQITLPEMKLISIPAEYTSAEAVKGPANAPVTILEFTDFQCPWCKRSQPTLRELENSFPGKLKFVSRQFPLQMHNRAYPASVAALCAKDQGKFWEYHDVLFAHQDKLGDEDLKKYAADLSLNTKKFNACLTSGKYDDQIAKDLEDGERFGVAGTPSFFVNGERFEGSPVDIPAFKKAVEAALAKTGSK